MGERRQLHTTDHSEKSAKMVRAIFYLERMLGIDEYEKENGKKMKDAGKFEDENRE